MEHGTLSDAELKLSRLEADRERIRTELAKAVEAADADSIFKFQRSLEESDVLLFAQRARCLRLEIAERETALADVEREIEVLQPELASSARRVEEAQMRLQEAVAEFNSYQARIFGFEAGKQNTKDEANEIKRELKALVNNRLNKAEVS